VTEKNNQSKEVQKLLLQVYKDIAQPGAVQLGRAIGSLFELLNTTVLFTVRNQNMERNLILQRNLKKLGNELKPIESESILDIAPEIGIPLLEKLFYVSDEELTTLYVALLKRAAVKEEAYLAHPSFVNCVTNLSPDEAKLILYLRGESLEAIAPYLLKQEKGIPPRQYYSDFGIVLLPYKNQRFYVSVKHANLWRESCSLRNHGTNKI